jgi:hypothetical protein
MEPIKIKIKMGSVEVEMTQEEMVGLRDALNALTGFSMPAYYHYPYITERRWGPWRGVTTDNVTYLSCGTGE